VAQVGQVVPGLGPKDTTARSKPLLCVRELAW